MLKKRKPQTTNLKLYEFPERTTCPAVEAAMFRAQVEYLIEDLISILPDELNFADSLLQYIINCYNDNYGTEHTLASKSELIALRGIQRYCNLLPNNKKG